jgi:hypothetical protein
LALKIINQTTNLQTVFFKATWGPFQRNVLVLNIQEHSKHIGRITEGSMGSVYDGNFRGFRTTLKCIPIRKGSQRNAAIREWFLLSIASALRAGPQLLNITGFHLLMYKDCAEFLMETCDPLASC